MATSQQLMLRVTGYTDRCSVRPGDEVIFFVHSEFNEPYQADIVRLIHGDTNPEGPGFKEKLVRTSTNRRYRGQHQAVHAGSYLMVPHDPRLDVQSFTLCAYIYPTTPVVDTEGVAATLYQTLRKSGLRVEYSSTWLRPRPIRSASSPLSLMNRP